MVEATTDVGPGIANPGRTRSACKSDPIWDPALEARQPDGLIVRPTATCQYCIGTGARDRVGSGASHACWARKRSNPQGVAIWISTKGKPLLPSFEGQATLTDARAVDMMAGLWYLNIHTARYPGGETRGQLELVK